MCKFLIGMFFPVLAFAQIPSGTTSGASAFGTSLRQPNVSADVTFLYRNSNYSQDETATTRNGLDLKEAELLFYGDVDPYSRLSTTIVVKPKYTAGTPPTKSWEVEAEEVYADLSQIPKVRVRLGKFDSMFGKENQVHSHALPFIDRSLANAAFFGDDPLNNFGVSAAYLLPTSWYSDFFIEYFNAPLNSPTFAGPAPSDGLGALRWANLVDLRDNMTFELGASIARGRNSTRGSSTTTGADLTLKWRPNQGGIYQSWIVQAEYIGREFEQTGSRLEKDSGLNVWTRYQFAQRWSAAVKWDTLKVDGAESAFQTNALTNGNSSKKSAALIYAPTEFSNYRFEMSQNNAPNLTTNGDEKRVYLQANFLIGAHPAHTY